MHKGQINITAQIVLIQKTVKSVRIMSNQSKLTYPPSQDCSKTSISNLGVDVSKLLINENPLVISPTLVIELGSFEAAAFLQQLHFWLGVTQYHFDGKPWVYNNTNQCVEMMRGTVSKRSIERIISHLKKRQLIVVARLHSNKWNKTNFFTINYEEFGKIESRYASNSCVPDTAKMAESKPPKWRDQDRQNGGIDNAKMAESLQKNTTEESKQNITDIQFEEFWKTVPNKDGKKPAQAAFKKAIKKISLDDLIIAYKANVQVCEAQNRFKKNPATWLNQECWNDDSIQNAIKQLKNPQSISNPEQQAQPTFKGVAKKFKGMNDD